MTVTKTERRVESSCRKQRGRGGGGEAGVDSSGDQFIYNASAEMKVSRKCHIVGQRTRKQLICEYTHLLAGAETGPAG